MKLSKDTPCNVFNIRKPIWSGRKVGIAAHRIGTHNEINILSTLVDGSRVYPNSYYISGEKARKYRTEQVKNSPSVTLHIIPIADLELLERE